MSIPRIFQAVLAGDGQAIRELCLKTPSLVKAVVPWSFSEKLLQPGDSPLHTALRVGNRPIIAQLVKLGAPLDFENWENQTPKRMGNLKKSSHAAFCRPIPPPHLNAPALKWTGQGWKPEDDPDFEGFIRPNRSRNYRVGGNKRPVNLLCKRGC